MTGHDGAYVASTLLWADLHFVCGDPVQHVPHLHSVGKNDTERQCCGFASCPHGTYPCACGQHLLPAEQRGGPCPRADESPSGGAA